MYLNVRVSHHTGMASLTPTVVFAAVAFDGLFPSIVYKAALPVLVRIVRWG